MAGLLIVVMAIMLDRTTTAASERSETGRTDVASVSGPGVMLTGVVLERLPRWATEDAGRGQRLPRLTASGRWLLQVLLLIPVASGLPLAPAAQLRRVPRRSETPVLKYISGTELTKLINDFTDWFDRHRRQLHHLALKDDVTNWSSTRCRTCSPSRRGGLMALVLLAVAYVLGGWRPTVITAVSAWRSSSAPGCGTTRWSR